MPSTRRSIPSYGSYPTVSWSRTVNPTHSYQAARNTGNAYITTYATAATSSPSVTRSSDQIPLPSIMHSTTTRKSTTPSHDSYTTTASTESTMFYTQYARDDELPTVTATPDVTTAVTVDTAPSVIPTPSSTPFGAYSAHHACYFASYFARIIPFLPHVKDLSGAIASDALS